MWYNHQNLDLEYDTRHKNGRDKSWQRDVEIWDPIFYIFRILSRSTRQFWTKDWMKKRMAATIGWPTRSSPAASPTTSSKRVTMWPREWPGVTRWTRGWPGVTRGARAARGPVRRHRCRLLTMRTITRKVGILEHLVIPNYFYDIKASLANPSTICLLFWCIDFWRKHDK